MKVGEAGEAFFVFETEHQVPEEFQTSPLLQAVPDTRSDHEEPPFLDISERREKKDDKDHNQQENDTFEDDQETHHIPAELQSPKMIIEEHMDKVVTELSDETKNTLYSMNDGSTLLERELPESITTTTLVKEQFIIRPVDGDIHSLWMDVTNTQIETPELKPAQSSSTYINKATEAIHGPTEKEYIMLDMSGYKTRNQADHVDVVTPANVDEQEVPTTTWGWGKAHADDTQDQVVSTEKYIKHEDGTIGLKSGQTYRIEMSLCGFAAFGYDQDENNMLFKDKQVSYDMFVHNPSILNDPRLVFRYEGHYYAAAHSNTLFTSLLVFKQPVQEKEATNVSDSKETYSYGRGWRQWLSRSSTAEPIPILNEENQEPIPQESTEQKTTTFTTTTKATSVGWSPDQQAQESGSRTDIFPKRKMYAKTLRLTSEQLKNLKLKKGVNTISFSVSSAYQGTATCVAKVFFWDYDIQVVISDIDGTITKSDTMGHLMTMIGKDWTHAGVAQLYTDISNNGYQFLYLTSRAIGQADYTRDYLKRVLQNNYQLPDGPVIMSPDRLFTSLHREVIIRKPEVFKMGCLKDIQRLFAGRDPFYAGFGNRITDAISYRSVNVPSSRIFTIDPQGDVKLELVTGFRSSYIYLNDMVDQIFPPIDKTVNEEFTDYNYWKTPMPEIDIPELEEEVVPTSPKPQPIKPDPASLPRESVVGYVPEKRSILRSFTRRRRAASTTTNKSNEKKTNESQTSLKKVTSLTHISEYHHAESENTSETSSLASPKSLPEDLSTIKKDTESIRSSSSGIMNKVMGGVFSRKIDVSEDNEDRKEEEYDLDIDDLDLDSIPFI
ncbi:Lipin/Ned1/Smp2-domain-containing protein [Thamnidium elegans]|nr:Lipin/Ned1/Smp2-domain-containing protein [Thamnidium elegans]